MIALIHFFVGVVVGLIGGVLIVSEVLSKKFGCKKIWKMKSKKPDIKDKNEF